MQLSEDQLKTLNVLLAEARAAEAKLVAHFTKALSEAGVPVVHKFWACHLCGKIYPKDIEKCGCQDG